MTETGPICPECQQGKHPNCDGTAWNNQADDLDRCHCPHQEHPMTDNQQQTQPRTAMEWLQDYADCLDGSRGPEAQRVADEWMEDHVDDLPTDGTSWKAWRDFRQTWSPTAEAQR